MQTFKLTPKNAIQNAHLPQGIKANESVLCQFVQAINRNNKVCKETNKIHQEEYKRKKDQDETKKDRTKDLHPSIKSMIKNISATKQDKAGELCKIFISLYNSKTHGGLNIQLHQLFDDIRMGDATFA
jgi:hypothetical protein